MKAKRKTPAKKRATKKIVREVWVAGRKNQVVMVFSREPSKETENDNCFWLEGGYLTTFCLSQARRFFDLRGLKPMTARKFRITTEVLTELKPKPKPKRKTKAKPGPMSRRW